jgi:hypothetical protein
MPSLCRWTTGAPSLLGPLDPPEKRIALDPESEPPIVLFRAGDVCGDCGAPLVIRGPESAACPNCGPDAIPF